MLFGGHAGSQLLFVGNERTSALTIYNLDGFPETAPVMVDNFFMANPTNNLTATWQELFDNRTIGTVDPESMKWVPIDDDEGHLFVAGAVSGTLTAFHVSISHIPDLACSPPLPVTKPN
eukprot:scaffold35152_cov30-Prasinocladus_malaysianus.AAC.1